MGKNNMLHNINRMLKVVLDDNREITGKLLVYDQHMNVVLSEANETRPLTKKMKEESINSTRSLGLILLRGEHIVSVTTLKNEKSEKAAAEAVDFGKAPKSRKAVAKRMREN
ncbi:unnamed protein product [Phytomonas sp. Hart1]|nr:unnamed protein product [Phytomonas sp. Hart1]|eukprot:CCW70489.1 unnamed protein product [Phytomonas sp. isolate Hart1]